MKYTINALAELAGVTTRALRHYESKGLLKPERNPSGYRIYGSEQVDTLQQILIYRELGIGLAKIKEIFESPSFNGLKAMESHLDELEKKRCQLDALIVNVKKTISAVKGEGQMSDKEKFEGFMRSLIEQNEKKYGAEARLIYGDESVDRSNAKLMGMSREKYEQMKNLSIQYMDNLKAAFKTGDPGGELAKKACAQHKQWLMFFWDSYSPEAHTGLAQMYVDDERFKENYERIAPGCAEFFRDAINEFCTKS